MNNAILAAAEKIPADLRRLKPIVHHITNYVTVCDCANITLAIGASPIMADDIGEVEEITGIASSLVLNIGTLNANTVKSMYAAGHKANEKGIPVIFDPVGAGASKLRSETAHEILKEVKISVLRGNMSEIRFISGLEANTKGVDASRDDMESGLENGIIMAKSLANKLGLTVAVTGPTDIISNGNRTLCIQNGHAAMGGLTGTGCMCTSLVGSFAGACNDYFLAAALGIMSMGIAGEIAFENAGTKGNGSFHSAIMDEISKLDFNIISGRAKIYEA